MKKIYLSLIILGFLLNANATERVWNFTNGFQIKDYSSANLAQAEPWTSIKNAGTDYTAYTATKCLSSCTQALELCKNYKTITKTKADTATTFGNFGQAFNFSGSATIPTATAIPVVDYIAINVAGNVNISFYCNPQTAVARTFRIVNSSGVVVNTLVTSAVSSPGNPGTEVITASYVGPATKLTIYPAFDNTSIVFLYAVICNDNPPAAINEVASSKVTVKKVGNQLQNEQAEQVQIYTVLGSKIMSSSETTIDISGLANGVYIARTVNGSLKFIK